MTAPAFEVGQVVHLLGYQDHSIEHRRKDARLTEGRVVKIGRTLVHVEAHGRVTGFDMTTGVERGDFPSIITTPEREAEHEAVLAMGRELAALGVETYRVRGQLSLATLTAIRDLVAAEARA